jgi:hypothetical protein
LPIVEFYAISEDEATANAGDENDADHEAWRARNRARTAWCRCFTGCPLKGIPAMVSLGWETPRSGTRRCKEHIV